MLAGYSLVKTRIDHRVQERLAEHDIRYLPSPTQARIMSFGFREALADLYWIEAINYFGGQLLNKERDYKYLQQYADLILHLDPYFTIFYDWAATAFIYDGMDIDRQSIVFATRYINEGIKNLHSVRRYNYSILTKGAFNYALEAQEFMKSIPYFEMAGRIFPEHRDQLIIASTYATYANDLKRSIELKEEYLGYMAFEATEREEIEYAIQMLSSPGLNQSATQFIRSLRLQLEQDEEMREIVEKRLQQNPMLQQAMLAPTDFSTNPQIDRVLEVSMERTWLPPELHILFSL